jgi:hypothetical protein
VPEQGRFTYARVFFTIADTRRWNADFSGVGNIGSDSHMAHWQTLKRSELYEIVWQEPMSRLAKRFAISDVGLAKICRKYNIPRPPRGYWAKKQHGQKPRQTPLPKTPRDEEIQLRDGAYETVASGITETIMAHIDAEKAKELPITVAETLRGSHDLVSRSNAELQGARVNDSGFIARPEKPTLDITVSKASLRRSLLIMDALLKALEARGYEVAAGPTAKILEASVGFGILETTETKKDPVEDHDLDGPYNFGHSRYNETRHPSGRLVLKIDAGGAYWLGGARHTWKDTDKSKLETRLNSFVAGLIEVAARIKQHEEEQQKRQEAARQEEARRQEQARQLAEKRKLFKAEQARVELLLEQADNWRSSKLVRELVEAVRVAHSENGTREVGPDTVSWMRWALEQADRLDPLRPSPPSILDEKLPPEEEPRRGYYG